MQRQSNQTLCRREDNTFTSAYYCTVCLENNIERKSSQGVQDHQICKTYFISVDNNYQAIKILHKMLVLILKKQLIPGFQYLMLCAMKQMH